MSNVVTKEDFDFDVLGLQGRDLVSGSRGTITSITESRSGSIQIAIEPKGFFGRPIDTFSYDFQQVEVFKEKSIQSRFKSRLPVIKTKPAFKLGERVKDLVSDATGFVIRRTTYMNGCILYTVLPDGEKKIAEALHIFQPLLESAQSDSDKDLTVGWDALNEEVVETAPDESETKPAKARTGGPAERSINSSSAL